MEATATVTPFLPQVMQSVHWRFPHFKIKRYIQSFFFDWNLVGQPVPIPTTRQCLVPPILSIDPQSIIRAMSDYSYRMGAWHRSWVHGFYQYFYDISHP